MKLFLWLLLCSHIFSCVAQRPSYSIEVIPNEEDTSKFTIQLETDKALYMKVKVYQNGTLVKNPTKRLNQDERTIPLTSCSVPISLQGVNYVTVEVKGSGINNSHYFRIDVTNQTIDRQRYAD